jgi:hypothetical protein
MRAPDILFAGFSLLALALLANPKPLAAQDGLREAAQVPEVVPKAAGGIHLQLALPQGAFADFVGTGYGLGGNVSFYFGRSGLFGLRLYGSWIQYGSETTRVPLSPTVPGILVDLTTSNNIYSFGFGPELLLGQGEWRPYLFAAIGASDFATESSVEGSDNFGSFARTTNFNDWVFGWYAGGGLQFRVKRGYKPIWLDGGLRYQSHGETRYLRKGSLQPAPGGGVTFDPIRSETDLLVVHLGIQASF